MGSDITPVLVIANRLGELYCFIDKEYICESKTKWYIPQWFGLEYFVFQDKSEFKRANINDLVIQHYDMLLPLNHQINMKRG